MKIFKRKFLIKLVLTMLLVWTILLVKMAIDTSVPNLQEPIEMLIFGGKQKQLRRNVGYYVGEDRVKKWGFKHMPNFTLMAEKFDLKTVGEMGEPIILGMRNLTREEATKMDNGFARHAINEYVGNLVSVRRKIPEARTHSCKRVKYPEDLPRTSIVMCFYNEAWTSLLRSVHSIIDRTPDRLLEEIILVDDNSTLEYLHDPLEEYMSQFPKVKLVRTGKRQGLIRARLFGFNHTSPRTSIVTFLDSHIECFEGWLEPMLLPIVEDSRAVTMPCINAIDDMTFRVDNGQPYQVGMFVLPSLRFAWMNIPEHELRRRRSTADPIRSPAMAGGLFTISKSYFNHIGTYDEQLNVWGGENIELSLKIWMCGGSILLTPCSHVGHIFRKRLPYAGGFRELMRNLARVANVWLDEYKDKFQNYRGNIEPYGDISDRLRLKEKLQCHSFDWYRQHAFPELYFVGSGVFYGTIRNVEEPNICIDANGGTPGNDIIPYGCHGGDSQKWDYTETMQIRQAGACMDWSSQKSVKNQKCIIQGSQGWKYKDQLIQNRNMEKCIGLSKDSKFIEMQKCDRRQKQLWIWPKVREPFVPDFFYFM